MLNPFIHDASWSTHHATSEIVKISKGRRRHNGFGFIHDATLRDGRQFVIDGHEADALTDSVMAVIPANAGYSTIETGICEDGSPWTIRETVLAWQVMQSGEMRPLTIRGPNNGEICPVAVEQPSGAIWCPTQDCIYPDFAEFEKAALNRMAEQAAERAVAHLAADTSQGDS